ncbi:MAG: type II secretion system protein GspK [Polyangiaceae bacterium]
MPLFAHEEEPAADSLWEYSTSSSPRSTTKKRRKGSPAPSASIYRSEEPRALGRSLRARHRRRGRQDQREPGLLQRDRPHPSGQRDRVSSSTQYAPMFEQRDATGQFQHAPADLRRGHRLGGHRRDRVQLRHDAGERRSAGPEDAYYSMLPVPYRRKNAPYDSLDELHMVRGISEDFWATFVDPDPNNPKKRVMTVWGQGSVNVNTANAQTLLAVVCAGAPQAEVCTDINQAQTFLTGVTMAQGITMGAPLFGSANDFVQTMKGKGQIGPGASTFGMKPVQFKSDADFAKSVTTESKIFSVYARGFVSGYKRETKTSIHAVVDFRNAPALSGGTGLPGLMGGLGGAPAPSASASASSKPPNQDPNAIAQAPAPNPGGQIVYFRIE